MRRESATSARKMKAAERMAAITQLRLRGATLDAIATELGIGRTTVRDALSRAQAANIALATETAAELRQQQAERLDAALLAIFTAVESGELGAIDRMLKIEERRARLYGLDAPARTELSGPGGGPLQAQNVPYDLSLLSDAELASLHALATKALPQPAAGEPTAPAAIAQD